jgi:nicotinamidase-related amidase
VSDNPNEITIDNSVLIFIDQQPWVASRSNRSTRDCSSITSQALRPAQRPSTFPPSSPPSAQKASSTTPPLKGLADVIPDVTPIDRVSTNAWEDLREAVAATGRKTLLMAGLWTEVCLAQTAVSAMAEGYRVFFVSDCSGGMNVEAHEDAKKRLVQAGATPINWMAVICEWTPVYTSDERQRVNTPVMEHGSMAGLAVEYLVAQTELLAHAS